MDIVSPRPQETVGLAEAPLTKLKRERTPSPSSTPNQPPPATENTSGPPAKEVVVENGLYTSTVSNKNGGSFASFILNQYDRYDSTLVNLIDGINKNNLLVGFVSLDGEQISLNNNWSVIGNPRRLDASTSQKNLLFFHFFSFINSLSKDFFCIRLIMPSRVNSKEAAKIPAIPVLFS